MDRKEGKYSSKNKEYLKYTGLAFQMAGVFAIAILGGQYLDKKMSFHTPIFTIALTIILFSGYMYKLYFDLTKNNE